MNKAPEPEKHKSAEKRGLANIYPDDGNPSLRFSHENYLAEKAERPGNLAFNLSRKRKLLDFSLLVVSGLLYSTIFPPLNLDFNAWFSLVLLFFLVRGRTGSSAFFRGWVWGYAWAAASFFWLREIEAFIPFLIAPILALFPALWCVAIPTLEKFLYYPEDIINKGFEEKRNYRENNQHSLAWNIKDIHFCLVLSALWVFLEWVRSWFLSGFPWNLTAVSQWRNPIIIQIADISGIYGVSFIIILLNISLCVTLAKYKSMISGGRFRRPAALYFSLIAIMFCLGYGTNKIMSHQPAKDSRLIKVAVIQADIPQCRLPTEEEAVFALEKHLELTELALLSDPDIVVWPEAAVPLPYRASHRVSVRYRKEISRMAKEKNIPFLLGTIDFGDVPFEKRRPEDIPIHNSAILVGPNADILEKYHKIHLVPFGEYTPFGDHFPKLKEYFGMGRNLTPGKDYTIFQLPEGVSAGVNICFEGIFPNLSRKFTKKGADILFIITNDAWYPISSQPEQHFSHSVFRAVENRRRIVRSGNNSFSSVLSPLGIIEDSLTYSKDPESGKMLPDPSKKTSGYAVFQVQAPFRQPITFYTKYGDVFILACSLLLLLSALEITWKWKNCRQSLADALKANETNGI